MIQLKEYGAACLFWLLAVLAACATFWPVGRAKKGLIVFAGCGVFVFLIVWTTAARGDDPWTNLMRLRRHTSPSNKTQQVDIEKLAETLAKKYPPQVINHEHEPVQERAGAADKATVRKITPPEKPDIQLFFFPSLDQTGMLVGLHNPSEALVREPYYMPVMWDLDADDYKQPLHVPARTFKDSWIRPKGNFGPYSITHSPEEIRVKHGDRIFGYVVVTCPDCKTQRIYWVYANSGTTEGWYSEATDAPSFSKIEAQIESIRRDLDGFLASYKGKRIPIQPYSN
ncbi:MAG: hypothetical protein ACR2IF_04695 [Terriglobales bacterium]